MAVAVILAYADDDTVILRKIIGKAGEVIGLDGAAGSVVFRVKIEGDVAFVLVIRQADSCAILIR